MKLKGQKAAKAAVAVKREARRAVDVLKDHFGHDFDVDADSRRVTLGLGALGRLAEDLVRVEKFMVGLYGALPRFTVQRVDGENTNTELATVVPYNADPETALTMVAEYDPVGVGDLLFISTVNWEN